MTPSIHPSLWYAPLHLPPTAFLFLLVLVLKSCVSLALSKGGYFHPASPSTLLPLTTHSSPLVTAACTAFPVWFGFGLHPPGPG